MNRSELGGKWLEVLADEIGKPYFKKLEEFVETDRSNHVVFPKPPYVFNAFGLTDFEEVKVVLVGQDPYHGEGQAHGLSFSVPEGVAFPPSLRNMLKELKNDFPEAEFASGNLSNWAAQGVFLINSVLTVRKKEPASHQKMGWESFTDATISALSERREHLVFLLWGNYAQSKKGLINSKKHLVLEAPHPSPFSAHKGFFGCKHFSKTNEYLVRNGIDPIDWSLPGNQLVLSGL